MLQIQFKDKTVKWTIYEHKLLFEIISKAFKL